MMLAQEPVHIGEMDAFHRKYEELEMLGEGGAAVVKKCRDKTT